MFDKVIISLSLALVTLTSPDHVTNKVGPRKQYFAQFKRPYDGSETGLDPRIGHGISPNFSPQFSPPVQTEHMPDIKDFLSFEGKNNLLRLSKPWSPISSYSVYSSCLWARYRSSQHLALCSQFPVSLLRLLGPRPPSLWLWQQWRPL